MKTGFVCGAWDLLHPGHVLLLAECKTYCDRLIVGLHIDPSFERSTKNKPVQTVYERYLQLAYHKSVYHIIPYETEGDLYNLLATIDIQIRFLGSDYASMPNFTGKSICALRNIEIKYIDRLHYWSSSELRKKL